MNKTDRRLVPIVSLDVAGYSRLIQHDEANTLAAVRRVFDGFARATLDEYGGWIFKTMGDGLLAEFSSVVAAVEWVARLQRTLHDHPVPAGGGEPLAIRAGLVLADVMVSGTDRYGDGINLAVRLQGCAPAGGMAISKWMHDYLAGKVDFSFSDIGSQALKNMARTMHVFIWHPDANVQHRAAAARGGAEGTGATEMRPSVAVLPFDNMSADPEQEYFADAVTEEITATLSRVGDFLVIARNSAFAFKGRAADVRQVGRDLGVRYVLEGSVRRVGDRIRITAQLVEAATAAHIWAGKEEGAASDLFDLQDRIAEMVAGAVYPSVRKAEIERALSKRPDNLEAYDLVMRSLPHLWAHRMHENPVAIALLEQALQLDPQYGLAAALCAWAHAQQIVYNWTFDQDGERQKGLALIETAARHIGEDATGLAALANAIMLLEGNARRALGFVERALKVDPNHAWAWMRRGFGLIYTGQPDEALASFARAERLSPLDPFTFNIHIGIGLAHFAAGRYAEAVPYPQMVLDERPGLTWPYRDLAAYRAQAGDLAGARDALEKFVYLRPPMTLASIADGLKFMEKPLLDRYIEGLRLAGME
jgi:TolB-like protein/class 3 adenylate cyclase/Tfp pilus assembly protein PilF